MWSVGRVNTKLSLKTEERFLYKGIPGENPVMPPGKELSWLAFLPLPWQMGDFFRIPDKRCPDRVDRIHSLPPVATPVLPMVTLEMVDDLLDFDPLLPLESGDRTPVQTG
jgi:hypothetical protein